MTRIAGTNLIKAPCCGAFFSTVAFASINFMASEHWTDGQDENSLSQSDGGLRRCTCGGYFLSGYAERVGFIPKNNGQQQEQTEYSISKIFGQIGKLLIAEDKAKPQIKIIAKSTAKTVSAEFFVELLDVKNQSSGIK